MIILGWIITIIGAVISITSLSSRENYIQEYNGIGRRINSGEIEDAELIIFIGIIIAVVGVIILIAGYLKSSKNTSVKTDKYTNSFDTIKCLKCGNIANLQEKFCSKCGNNLYEQRNKL